MVGAITARRDIKSRNVKHHSFIQSIITLLLQKGFDALSAPKGSEYKLVSVSLIFDGIVLLRYCMRQQ